MPRFITNVELTDKTVAKPSTPATVYLGLGSNVDAENKLRSALKHLEAEFGQVELSPVYRSKAVGFSGDDFLNACCRIETHRSPGELKHWLAELEDQHGRRRDLPKFADRTLDIDILLYDDLVGEFDGLELPRDEILKYAHVLKPLADLAGELIHPGTDRSYSQYWQAFAGTDSMAVVEIQKRG